MTYQEQLQSNEWFDFRTKILTRDKNTCQVCSNQKYVDLFEIGIIFGRKSGSSGAPINEYKEYYRLPIWNLKSGLVDLAVLNKASCLDFDVNQSYVCYYHQETKQLESKIKISLYKSIKAIRSIDPSKIVFNKNILETVFEGIKSTVDASTFNEIYRSIIKTEKWKFVSDLHVHHKCYRTGHLAWEYEPTDLVTLCWDCHREFHENNTVKCFDSSGKEIGEYHICPKCYGSGYLHEYKQVENGICFQCSGAKYVELTQTSKKE